MKPPHTPRAGSSHHGKGDTRPPHPGGPVRPPRADRPRAPDQQRGDTRNGTPSRPAGDAPRLGLPVKPRPPAAEPSRAPTRRAEADSPRGTVWLYGTHAVAAALANPNRRPRRLMLTSEAEAALTARVPQPWPISPERTERGRLDQLLGRDIVHQGVALLADLLAPPALARVLERPGPVIVLDQVTDPRNVGAILRCAAAFGSAAVITQDRNAPEENGALAKAASGALETMPLLRAVNIARTLVALKAAGCWVVGLDSGGANLTGPSLAQRRVALVLGNEGEGLRRLTRDTCDEIAGIAMPGGGNGLDSLNVAAAAAVALYELGRSA
jgi:23S rRNA (guanosine2251-2'-O)-methyltransferase